MNGSIRYNTNNNAFEFFQNGVWVNYDTGAGGSVTWPLTASPNTAAPGAPQYTFGGSTTTGVYSPGTTTLGFVTNGSERIRIDAAGNVGIGTTAPVNTLDIGTGGGIHIASGIPTSTSNAIYNNGGTLMWNGSALSASGLSNSPSDQSSLLIRGNNSSTATGTVTVPWPAGTLAGDLALLCVGNIGGATGPTATGWTNIDSQTGPYISGYCWDKTLTAADISAGGAALTMASQGVIGVVTFIGNGAIRNYNSLRNGTGTGLTSQSVSVTGVQAGDQMIYFGYKRALSTNTVSMGTLLSAFNDGSGESGMLYGGASSTTGLLVPYSITLWPAKENISNSFGFLSNWHISAGCEYCWPERRQCTSITKRWNRRI